jgi:cell wall-associated NlpC family hydrolase
VRAHRSWLRQYAVAAGLAVALCVTVCQPAQAHGSSNTPPPVTTCATLSAGAVGPAVKTIQKAIGATADGDFGPATRKAVRGWQKTHDVPVTGVIDAATWTSLPIGTRLPACGQKVNGTGVAVTCAALSQGATGTAVGVLQTALGTTVDGQFGAGTANAVRQVQTDRELKVTGITNIATWKALHRWGTPICSTKNTVGPHESKDAKAQAKIRAHVQALAAALEHKPGTTKNQVAQQAMAFAKSQLGKPYVYGGVGPKGYDCSGLQMTAYQHAGLTIPRVAAAQYAGAGTPVPLDQAKQGDLLFFASDVTKPSTTYHVSMYVGGGNMIEAPHTGANVRIVPLWTTDLLPTVVRPVAGLSLPLKHGDTGWTVTQLQQSLNRHGSALGVDGGFGPSTVAAVKAWQTAHHLSPNGVVRMTTWLTLR